MKHNYIIALLIAFCMSFTTQTQAQTPSLRGIYINDFSSVFGNTVLEDSILKYAQDSSFNYIALYDLHTINFSNTAQKNQLASFIKRAKQNYGITYVGAVGESYSSFQTKIGPYNTGRTDPQERFDVFNLEFEFWTTSSVSPGGYYCTQYLQPNGCSCDSAGAFRFFITNMHSIDSLANAQGATSETYLGWFNQGQGSQIQQNVDRILLHAYRVDNSSVYGYSKTRLSYLASNSTNVQVAPIFSSEPSFMGPWLNSHAQIEAYNKYRTDFTNDNGSYTGFINLLGYQWFDYGYMPKAASGGGGSSFTPTISSVGSTTFCSGGSVILTAGGGTSYFWSSGQTTSSITVSSSGTYSCQVTKNGVTQTTSAITVTVNPTPTVSVTAGALNNYTVPLSASASTTGNATIASYQWKKDNINISGATASTLDASSSGDYTVTVANTLGCATTSAAESVLIPGVCTLTTPSGVKATCMGSITEKISWSALPQCDSIIIRYRPDASSTNLYVRLPYTGQTEYTLTGLQTKTKYQYRIKTVCGTTSGSYSGTKFFTTGRQILEQTLTSQSTKLKDDTGMWNTEEENTLSVYPNPVRDNMTITFVSEAESDMLITVSDITGREIRSERKHMNSGENTLNYDLSALVNGIYFLTISNADIRETSRIIIQK